MRRSIFALPLILTLSACAAPPAYQTYATAFGDYDRVFQTTVAVLDKYSFLRVVNPDSGVVVGELKPDNRFMDPTRREVIGRVLRKDQYNDVEVRVVYSVDEGQPSPFTGSVPTYQWQRLDFDRDLETKLTLEIKETLSGGQWAGKAPLPGSVAPQAAAAPAPAEPVSEADQAVLDALSERIVSWSFDESPLTEVFDFIRDSVGLNVVLSYSARQALDETDARVSLKLNEVSLATGLSILSEVSPVPFGYHIADGVLVITAPKMEMR